MLRVSTNTKSALPTGFIESLTSSLGCSNPIWIATCLAKGPITWLKTLHDLVGASQRVAPIQLATVIFLRRNGNLRNQLHRLGGGGLRFRLRFLCVHLGFGSSVPKIMLHRLGDRGSGVIELRVALGVDVSESA